MRLALFVWYLTPVMWRHLQGRWYVFRSSPLWVVEEVAEMSPNTDDNEMNEFILAARAELLLRARQESKKT